MRRRPHESSIQPLLDGRDSPRLSPEVRNAILAATLEVRKYEEENSKEQARAIAELEDFLRTPPRIPTTTSQESVPETNHPDLMELN